MTANYHTFNRLTVELFKYSRSVVQRLVLSSVYFCLSPQSKGGERKEQSFLTAYIIVQLGGFLECFWKMKVQLSCVCCVECTNSLKDI